jgi:hypothetical protein
MASPYFSGTTPGSFLPQGYMEAATAPGRAYAAGIGKLGEGIGRRLERARERKKDDEYFDFIERMGKTPKTSSEMVKVPELVERGRPRTDEAAGDYFNDQLASRDSYQKQLDWLSSLEGDSGAGKRLKAYAADELPEDHPLHALIKTGDLMIEEASQTRAEEMGAEFNDMVLQSIRSRTQRPDPTQRQGGSRVADPFSEIMMDPEESQRVNQILGDAYKESEKWLKDYTDGTKSMMSDREKSLDDFMAGKDEKGKALMELRDKEVEVKSPMSIKERRDIVMNDLSGLGRKLGRERYKEARTEVDKLFPRSPEIGVEEKGGALIITEDGAYKVAMAKPKLQGNSMFERLSESVQKVVPGLQDDARKDPTIAKYMESYSALNIMRSAAGLGTGAGDLALITKFMKALDPDSVVRESEQAQAQNLGPAIDVIQRYFVTMTASDTLLPSQREEIVAAAEKLVGSSRDLADFKVTDFKKMGKRMGVPEELFIPSLPGGEGVAEETEAAIPSWNPATQTWSDIDAGN